jgi:ABC-type tungstate transport system permease subunit
VQGLSWRIRVIVLLNALMGCLPSPVSWYTGCRRRVKTIKEKGAPFVSRGDRSGTHIAEIALWKTAGIEIAADKGHWYKEIGQGMGAALNMASSSNAYLLSDRGTWLAFKNRGDLAILVEGDKRLFNQYGVMLVNPAKHPTVKAEAGQKFIDWLISPAQQRETIGGTCPCPPSPNSLPATTACRCPSRCPIPPTA